MPAELTAADMARWLPSGARVYWPGCAGHSPWFEAAFAARPEIAAGLCFSGMWIPGVNRFDPCGWHTSSRAHAFFMTLELRSSWQRGAVQHLPLHYSEAATWMAQANRYDVLLLHVAPPDANGQCSLALAADFTPSALAGLRSGGTVLAHVNPLLPRTAGPALSASQITAWVEAAMPPLTLAAEPEGDARLQAVAAQVAQHVHDGDTLQLGLGRLQAAMLKALRQHRHLRLHSGMVSDGLLGLHEAGALAAPSASAPPVTTGVALGSTDLYAAVADPTLVRFAPVSHTHAHSTLAALPRLVSINSALQVDLLGQVNAETIDGQQISGGGGLTDFVRGARASVGGRSVVALTAASSRASRIVALLGPGPVSVSRADVDTVVTEHGAAHLRHLGVDARAQALIAIAAPEHRDALAQAWHKLRRTF
jgi:acyl-CoA hydrolase